MADVTWLFWLDLNNTPSLVFDNAFVALGSSRVDRHPYLDLAWLSRSVFYASVRIFCLLDIKDKIQANWKLFVVSDNTNKAMCYTSMTHLPINSWSGKLKCLKPFRGIGDLYFFFSISILIHDSHIDHMRFLSLTF